MYSSIYFTEILINSAVIHAINGKGTWGNQEVR